MPADEVAHLSSMTVLRPSAFARAIGSNPNIVATGSARGGTSMIGALLRHLGFIGEGLLHPLTHENLDLVELIETGNIEGVVEFLRERRQIPGWSLKLPWAMSSLPLFQEQLPNPVFIIVLRNPLEVVKSLVRYDERFQEGSAHDYARAFGMMNEYYSYGFSEMSKLSAPVVFCNFDTVAVAPKDFIRDFCALLGVHVTDQKIEEAVQLISHGYTAVNPAQETDASEHLLSQDDDRG